MTSPLKVGSVSGRRGLVTVEMVLSLDFVPENFGPEEKNFQEQNPVTKPFPL